jgi:hypothetical protein
LASFLRSRYAALALIALLCVLAYAPALRLPLIEDDYPNLAQAQQIGFAGAVANPVFRLRATSTWLMLALWDSVRLTPFVYHLVSLALHVADCWLVYFICLSLARLRPAAFWAAAFFAVQEGHQEAVMWFSAVNELLQFAFGCAALLCFLKARESSSRWPLYLAALALFACALLSKESAIIWLPLFALTVPRTNWRSAAIRLAPFAILGALALLSLATTRDYSFRFADGSFSLHAPFWRTLPRGIFRVLWIWGFVATAALVRYRKDRALVQTAFVALAWIVIALVPYSFLTYSADIPSRQTYLASAGLAAIVGLVLARLAAEPAPGSRIAFALAALMLIHNVAYLWAKKRAQFVARAEPTEALIRLAHSTRGPIYVKCFPRPVWIAQEALHLGAGVALADIELTAEQAAQRPPAAVYCASE